MNPATEPFATQQSTDMEVFVRGACAIVPPATTCSGQASVFIEDAKTLTLKSAVNIADHVPLANAVTRDSQDTVYVTGFAERIEVFPLVDPIQGASGGSTDAYVMVFAPSTRQILFSTFLGGSGHEEANGIALDPQGNIYVAGQTTSPNFPTANAYQATPPAPNGVSIGEGNSFIAKIALRAAPVPCTVDANTLCLNNGRFKVRVNWNVPSQGRNGVGTAVPLTGDTGYFWFFTGANIELVVKVLDAKAVNQHFWVFYGALSNVEYTITVTDTITGAVKTYNNADGNLASVADTSAFQASTITPSGLGIAAEAASEDEIETRSAAELYGIYAALTQAPSALTAEAAPCTADSTTLCLNQGRFQLRVDWEVPSQARSGHGTAVPVTGDTGYFWFFTSANIELVIKVLDARGVNQHFWVFYGALSNVKYTITITDMQTGAVKVYNNPDGNLASVADTSAF